MMAAVEVWYGIFALSTSFLVFLNVSCVNAIDADVPAGPQLVFDDEHIVLFRTTTLENFYKCLCNSTKTSCRYRYVYNEGRNFHRVDRNPTEQEDDDSDDNNMARNNFICHSEPFETRRGFISCTRSSDPHKWCRSETYCQPFWVNLSEDDKYDGCSVRCINMIWLAINVEGKHFDDTPGFESDICVAEEPVTSAEPNPQTSPSREDTTGGTLPQESTSPENDVTNAPQDQKSTNSDNQVLKATTAVGWILFALAVVIIVVLIFFLCKKSKLDSNKPKLERTASRPNAYADHSATPAADERNERSGMRLPVPETGKDRTDYDYYTAYGLDSNDYNVIDEERVTAASKKLSKFKQIKARLAGHNLPSPVAIVSESRTTERRGYSEASHPSSAQDKKQTTAAPAKEAHPGYNSIDDSQNSLESGGDLSAYNLASESPSENYSLAGTQCSAEDKKPTPSGGQGEEVNHGYMTPSVSKDTRGSEGVLGTYNLASGSLSPIPAEDSGRHTENDNVSINSLNITDYDKLKIGKLCLSADVDLSTPDTYNTASTVFEEREKIGAVDAMEPTVTPYDFPKKQEAAN